MPKYDAFGREIGEDTLAGLGGGSTAAEPSAAPAEPAARPQPEPQPMRSFDLPAPAAPVVRVRRRGGVGCLVGLIILVAVVAGPIVALVSFVDDAGDTFDEITGAIDPAPEPAVPGAPERPAQPPTGLGGASLVSQANFGKALVRLRKGAPGRITLLRLAPERLDAQLVNGGRQRSAQVTFEGELNRGPSSPAGGSLGTVAFAAIDRSAPARLVRGSAAAYPVREQGINYLVLTADPAGGHRWIAYFKSGVYVEGDRNGRVVRRIN